MTRYSYRRGGRGNSFRNFLVREKNRLRNFIKPGSFRIGAKKVVGGAKRINGKSIPKFVRKSVIDALSFKKIFLIWIIIIIIFGFFYSALEYLSPENGLLGLEPGPLFYTLLNSIYFSFITATSTGFGDITPLGFSRLISIVEAVSGMVMFGVVLSKLVSFKQEVILNEIYDISFDEKVNRLRSAMYLPRSDMDNLLHRFSDGKTPRGASEYLWSAINSTNDALIEIHRVTCVKHSKKREFVKRVGSFQLELVLNSIKLTMNKLNELLAHLNEVSYNWRSEKNAEGIRSMLSIVENICNYHRLSSDSPSVAKRINELEVARKVIQARLSR